MDSIGPTNISAWLREIGVCHFKSWREACIFRSMSARQVRTHVVLA